LSFVIWLFVPTGNKINLCGMVSRMAVSAYHLDKERILQDKGGCSNTLTTTNMHVEGDIDDSESMGSEDVSMEGMQQYTLNKRKSL
jgi:hypothetical protein